MLSAQLVDTLIKKQGFSYVAQIRLFFKVNIRRRLPNTDIGMK